MVRAMCNVTSAHHEPLLLFARHTYGTAVVVVVVHLSSTSTIFIPNRTWYGKECIYNGSVHYTYGTYYRTDVHDFDIRYVQTGNDETGNETNTVLVPYEYS